MIPLPELFGGPGSTPAVIEAGTIGWDSEADVADMGTEANDGTTLVRVQLFRGKDPTADVQPGVAQGHKILARLNGFPFWCVPPRGLQCYVAFPAGFGLTPGAGVIIALPGANPFVQFSKSRAKLDVGPEMDLVIKARSITLSTYDNDFVAIGPDSGIMISDHNGNVVQMKDDQIVIAVASDGDAKTILRLTPELLSLAQKAANGVVAGLNLKDGDVVPAGANFQAYTAGLNLGPAATAATPAIIGVGTAAVVTAWIAAFTAWMSTVSSFTGAVNPGPPPIAGSATTNVQP